MISAVLGGRSLPISPCRPSRTRQKSSIDSGSRVKSAARNGSMGSEHLGGGGLAGREPLGVVGAELDQQRR